MRPKRNVTTPPQPTMKGHTLRLAVATVIGVSLMLFLLMMAVKYAQRDWSKKNQRAKASHSHPVSVPVLEPESDSIRAEEWTYELPPAATGHVLDQLALLPEGPNAWLLLSRGLPEKSEVDLVIASLRMAMATGGDSAIIRNDMGAADLRQKNLRQAKVQFWTADQLQPGFAPARYNLALCAISQRKPTRAVRLLGQYLGQRPLDSTALRLQSILLTQLGRPEEALYLLENYLKDQPVTEPLFLEVAMLAARLGHNGNAIRYLETAMNGNPIQMVIRTYQSPSFRLIRLSGAGEALTARMANKARATFSTAVPQNEIRPLRATTPKAIVH